MVVGTKGTSRVTRSVPGKAVGWDGTLVCTAPRAVSGRYGCVGTTVVAGLVKSLKTGYDNDVRSKIVGVEPKVTEKGS